MKTLDKGKVMLIIISILSVFLIISFVVIWVFIKNNRRLIRIIKYHQRKIKEKSQMKMQEDKHNMNMVQRMIPVELFEFLQIKDISEVSFEKQRQTETISMHINNNEFSRIVHSREAEKIFLFINQFLNEAVPQIYENGGVIEGFQEAGMTVLFFKEYDKAVVAAISIVELLNELSMKKREPHYDNFSIGLCYDNSIIGVVGHPERMSLLTLSAYTSGLSRWLQSIAEKYYAKILVTDSCVEKITDFQKKFHVRFLGYIYIKDTDRIEKIYDVFDGDEQEIRNRKRQTRMVFEKGVHLFSKQNYQEARQYFIEVLKTDHFDKAAKEYIYFCEYYLKETNEKRKVYLECYE